MNEELIVCLDDQVGGGSSSVDMSTHLLAECGICWGTIKFEDIFSDVCTDVSYNIFFAFSRKLI